MNLMRMGLSFILGLYIAQNDFVLAQEAAPEPSTQAATPQAVSQETSRQAEKSAVSTETSPIEIHPVMEIKRLDTEEPLYSFELRDVELGDLFRVIAHDYKLNLLVDKEVSGQLTASLISISLEEAIETIAESQNLKLEKKRNILWVKPNLITKTFILKYIEAEGVLQPSSYSSTDSANGPISIYGLLSEKGKILLGRQPNSLMVIDYPPYVEKVEEYLKAIDRKMSLRLFKLKYLKAAEVVGKTSSNAATNSSETTLTTIPATAASPSQ